MELFINLCVIVSICLAFAYLSYVILYPEKF